MSLIFRIGVFCVVVGVVVVIYFVIVVVVSVWSLVCVVFII